MLKLKMMAWRDDARAGRRRLHDAVPVVRQCEAAHASGVDTQPPPDWQTPLNGIISPRREADCKNNWKELQKYINEQSADSIAHIDGQLMQLL